MKRTCWTSLRNLGIGFYEELQVLAAFDILGESMIGGEG